MKKLLPILITFVAMLIASDLIAQCPMCKASVESNLKEGGTTGLGLNAGIIYLFVTPYLLAVAIGFTFWWKNRNRSTKHS